MRYVFFTAALLLLAAAAALFYVRQNDTELVCFVGKNARLVDFEHNAVTGSLRFDGTDISGSEFEKGVVRFRYGLDAYMNVELETQDIWIARKGKTKAKARVGDRGECAPTHATAAEKQAAYEKANAMTEHASCKDEASAQTYVMAFSDALRAYYVQAPDPSKMAELQAEMLKITEGLDEGDYGALCVKLDALRRKYGF